MGDEEEWMKYGRWRMRRNEEQMENGGGGDYEMWEELEEEG